MSGAGPLDDNPPRPQTAARMEDESGLAPVPLCRAADIMAGQPVPVAPAGLPRLAVYRIGDRYHATADQCTHGNARLSDGGQLGGTIWCPLHGGAFDIASGRPVAPPCRARLETYPVHVADGWVWLDGPARRRVPGGAA